MTQQALRLSLSDEVLAALKTLLNIALNLPEGADVVDELAPNPWGDLVRFRREVYLPLHGEAPPVAPSPARNVVVLDSQDVIPVRDVLDGLAESFSGGVEWVTLSPAERDVVSRLLARLGADDGHA